MGLNNGITIVFRDRGSREIPFIVMWNDDYYIDEMYKGLYDPGKHRIYVSIHMVHKGRTARLRGRHSYYYATSLFKRNGKEPKIVITAPHVFEYGDFIVLANEEDEYYMKVIDSVVHASCELVLRRLYDYEMEIKYGGVDTRAVPFTIVAKLVYEDIVYENDLGIAYYLMERIPVPYGMFTLYIYSREGVLTGARTTLPANHKYIDPPKYFVPINPLYEYCIAEDKIITCNDNHNTVDVSKKLVNYRFYPPHYMDLWIYRLMGDQFKGAVHRISSITLSPLLYHITYGYIW